MKIALVQKQHGVRGKEAKRPSVEACTPAFRWGGAARVWPASAFSPAEVLVPEGRAQEEAGDRLQEHPSGRPDEMHVHSLRDKYLPPQRELVVQSPRRQGQTSNPEPATDTGEPLQVELLLLHIGSFSST
ncbi:hypothetical protein BM221_009802 [Beauveria bassiana]|uniref:Uncharacterized protein n=1 Tax=Beauveria bassiana TaxID=176275 RepID=A0A2N6NAV9_BEABA|nr:hypothetical protein BM221_009802 [Beauveria bassiana]